ncbi:hypothetical protein [Sphingomonas sp. NPDC079357]|uniref:hypothetical protein n=1 Tax=Sphingomonas sp. NPDC079357 TaxID=3364518 RepID=UPI00384F7543
MPPAFIAALVTFVAFLIGLTLPDLDLRLWLGHRSALTHSIVPACALLARRRWYPAACGMGAGTGLHLAADTFPNRMIGYATVKLPLVGALSAGASYLWLAANAVAALALAAWLARRLHAPAIAGLLKLTVLAAGARYLWRTDGGWPVLALAAVALSLALRWRYARQA